MFEKKLLKKLTLLQFRERVKSNSLVLTFIRFSNTFTSNQRKGVFTEACGRMTVGGV
jgi:hypothetical protein